MMALVVVNSLSELEHYMCSYKAKKEQLQTKLATNYLYDSYQTDSWWNILM